MTSPAAPSPTPPPWPHCAEGTTTTDPVGCRGVHVTGHTRCLAHLPSPDRAAHLAALVPGSNVDHRGTTFDGPLLTALLDALRDPITARPRLGSALFEAATFTADADFRGATFTADARFDTAAFTARARFDRATFTDAAQFERATFSADARFDRATFTARAQFYGATFDSHAQFGDVTFTANAWFNRATFSAGAWFDGAAFSADARFDAAEFGAAADFGDATFTARARFGAVIFSADARFDAATFGADADFGDATFTARARFGGTRFRGNASFADTGFVGRVMFGRTRFHADATMVGAVFDSEAFFGGTVFEEHANFAGATFRGTTLLGPLECRGRLILTGAVFGVPATIQAVATAVECVRTRWDSAATMRLRYAYVDLTDAVLTNNPVTIATHTAPFVDTYGIAVDERAMTGTPDIRLGSLAGVDAAHLVLTNTDLTECRFFGAVHLDQLRLGGETAFARTPPGMDVRRVVPLRWTDRLALAEEHHWRATAPGRARLRAGWATAPPQPGPAACPPGPPALAALYRQLRKAFEDGKDEPGAADFYMAEMEMRRLDRRPGRGHAERGLLTAYWALSGYGLRASRALAWLLLAMAATVLAMVLWGLPTSDPKPLTTGTQAAPGQPVSLTTDNPEPVLTGPPRTRLTGKRAEKATRVVLNSVVFRSSGQNLTTAGTYIEMTSRFLEPVLLGLAALAIRGRVKR
ncbi:hypothetical protein B4N89_39555 [Embleya scabrispora]|uniref:Metal transporter n=1 Tax=Embleya scabrispora TaxID=159449 RepID=A0A1T3NMY3_9ACTN|nr:pentapeptide repeat-containing protein [Embleya scabrispora]OPC78273.1 hypothetical protein B4N89_39555 [Embleya scabrispora]